GPGRRRRPPGGSRPRSTWPGWRSKSPPATTSWAASPGGGRDSSSRPPVRSGEKPGSTWSGRCAFRRYPSRRSGEAGRVWRHRPHGLSSALGRAISSAGERCLHTAEVEGSKPPSPTSKTAGQGLFRGPLFFVCTSSLAAEGAKSARNFEHVSWGAALVPVSYRLLVLSSSCVVCRFTHAERTGKD